jgi:cell division protein FtsB
MSRRKVVVTHQSMQTRRWLLSGTAALVMLVGLVSYEVGQNLAGFSRIDALESSVLLEAELKKLSKEKKSLSEQIAVLETSVKIDREAYRKVESQLVGLQSRILEQQEDIEFYKGIVNENDGTGLRIQDFQVAQGLGVREFDLRLVLAQAFRSTKLVSGRVEMVVEGLQEGEPVRLALADLVSDSDSGKLAYSFRYFQDLKAEVVIPPDFIPERVHVIVHSKGKNSKTVEDFFVWDVKPG